MLERAVHQGRIERPRFERLDRVLRPDRIHDEEVATVDGREGKRVFRKLKYAAPRKSIQYGANAVGVEPVAPDRRLLTSGARDESAIVAPGHARAAIHEQVVAPTAFAENTLNPSGFPDSRRPGIRYLSGRFRERYIHPKWAPVLHFSPRVNAADMVASGPMSARPRVPERSRRAAFLDRDGVLVEILRDAELGILYTAFHPDHLRPVRGAVESLKRLRSLGYQCIVVTNQPGPAKGHFTLAQLDRMNARLGELFELDAIYSCPHHPDGAVGGDPTLIRACECRKPLPGMLLQAARERGLDLASSIMIGDSSDDVRAGKAAGVRTILINGGRCELCPNRAVVSPIPDATVPSLADAVSWIALERR
jgi:D-glycero-D-manno-heptose 1,7-bisphosphate phosphatase